jgi:hypothetical protein
VHEPSNYLGNFLSVSVSKLIGKDEAFSGLPANGSVFSDPSSSAGAYGWSVGVGTSTSFSLSAACTYYPHVFAFVPEDIGRKISPSEILDFARYALGVGSIDWQ